MRGDRPPTSSASSKALAFTPHARGSTLAGFFVFPRTLVYPACAGIDRWRSHQSSEEYRLPRMRGDRPSSLGSNIHTRWFTPHARGSTVIPVPGSSLILVYPACAGIDLVSCFNVPLKNRLPRMRGDRPPPIEVYRQHYQFTPHARGSTMSLRLAGAGKQVYPACAGIDRLNK